VGGAGAGSQWRSLREKGGREHGRAGRQRAVRECGVRPRKRTWAGVAASGRGHTVADGNDERSEESMRPFFFFWWHDLRSNWAIGPGAQPPDGMDACTVSLLISYCLWRASAAFSISSDPLFSNKISSRLNVSSLPVKGILYL
jgi:hypothetical protein